MSMRALERLSSACAAGALIPAWVRIPA